MRKFNKKMGRSRSGVSDIIGNLLILAITVTLFSSIMFYVANMPEPAESTFTDLEPSLSNIMDDNSIYINVTHKGGQTLKNWTTGIYIFVNGVFTEENYISDSLIDIGDTWETGEIWSNRTYFEEALTSLSIMIVDKDTNSIVWQTDLLGGVTNIQLAPIIGTRYTSPSPGLENRSLTVFVQVMDPNGDEITDVWLDITTLGISNTHLSMAKVSQNLYSAKISDAASFDWDNRRIVIFASDDYGYNSAIMTLQINPTSSGGGGGGSGDDDFSNFDISGLQGFAIFEESDWDVNYLKSTKTNVFLRDEQNAVVVMITKTVVNTIGENEIKVMDPTTKITVSSVSSPIVTFKYYNFVAGYYVYNCTVDTSTLSGNYSLSATITDSKSPSNTFTMNSWMYVIEATGQDTGYPKITTYLDSSYDTICNDFSVSDSELNKIYVEIETENTYSYVSSSGNVEIRDFEWNMQLKRAPATPTRSGTTDWQASTWNGPVSNIWQITGISTGKYRFEINLSNCTSGAEWIAGNNAYILRFDVFKTTGESYLLNKVIHIDAPTTKYDIVAGLELAGGSAWATQATLFYYTNDNNWLPPSIMETTSDRTLSNPAIYALEAGDIDDNGIGDFAALVATGKVSASKMKAIGLYPVIYTATSGGAYYKTTLPAILYKDSGITIPSDLCLDLGNVDEDDDMDMVIAYNSGVYLYRNDGYWTKTTIATGVGAIVDVRLADMDAPSTTGNDPERSLDIVIVTTSTIIVYQNSDGAGNYYPADVISLEASSGSTTISDFASSEYTINGTVESGDYTQTRGDIDTSVYELLKEETNYNTVTTFPTDIGGTNTAGDDLEQMKFNNDSDLFTILENKVMNVTVWDSTYIDLPSGDIEVMMILNYSGTGFTSSIPLEYFDATTSTWETLTDITDGEHYLEIPLNFISDANELTSLNVRFINGAGSTLNIDVMNINVTYMAGDSLNHVWAYHLTAGSSYYFNLFTAINASADGDTFKFQYSITPEDDTSWTDITTITNTGAMASITAVSLPDTIGGHTVYVRVISAGPSTDDPSNDWIKVGQMYIECTATLSKIGKTIQAFDIADIDGNGANDIIVCTVDTASSSYGDVWILYNRDYYTAPTVLESGIFRDVNIVEIVKQSTSIATGVTTFEVGRFFGDWNDTYLDIVIGVGNTFYAVDQPSSGFVEGTFYSLTTLTFLSGMSVSVVTAEDIDGNGRTDLVFGNNNGSIVYWANYGGTLNTATWAGYTWQRYLIDDLGDEPILDISAGGIIV